MSNYPFKRDDNQSKLSSNYPLFNAADKLQPIPSYPAAERFKEIVETAKAREINDKSHSNATQPKIHYNPSYIPDTLPEYGFKLDKAQPINPYGSRVDYFAGSTAASLQELRGEQYQFNKAQAAGDQVSMDFYQRKINALKAQIFPNGPAGQVQKEIDQLSNQIQTSYDMNNPLPQALNKKLKMHGVATSKDWEQAKKDKIEELEKVRDNIYNYEVDDNNAPPPNNNNPPPPGSNEEMNYNYNVPYDSINYFTNTLPAPINSHDDIKGMDGKSMEEKQLKKVSNKIKKEIKKQQEGGYRMMDNPLLQDEGILKTLQAIERTGISKTMKMENENIAKTREKFDAPELFYDNEEFESDIYIAPEIQSILNDLPSAESKAIENLKIEIQNILDKAVQKAKDLPSREAVLELIKNALQEIESKVKYFIQATSKSWNVSKPILKEISKFLYSAVKIFAISASKLGVLAGKIGVVSAISVGYAALKLSSASIQNIILAFQMYEEHKYEQFKKKKQKQEEPKFNYAHDYNIEEKKYERSMPQLEDQYAFDYRQPKPKKPRKSKKSEIQQLEESKDFKYGPYELTRGAKGKGLKRSHYHISGRGYDNEEDFLRNVSRTNNQFHIPQEAKRSKNGISYDDGECGIYLIDKNKLKMNPPILSVLRARNRKKTNEYKNQQISPECAHCIFQILAHCQPDISKLTYREKVIVSKLIKRSRHPHLQTYYPYVKRADPYPIDPVKVNKIDPIISLKRQLRRNLGEIKTGNDSGEMNYKTFQIVYELYKQKHITLEQFNKYCNQFNLRSHYTKTASDRAIENEESD
jgi:hypothetical protein